MSTTTIIVIAVIVVIALLLLFVLRGRKQHVTFSDTAPLARSAPGASTPPVVPLDSSAQPESHGVATEIADAIEDVVDQFVGIDSHPNDTAKGPGDTLTLLKGLGPKAAAVLQDLGVTRFDQIASWNEADIAAIDKRMGAFQGRITRDRWVEQARLLANGDTEGFEAAFGALSR